MWRLTIQLCLFMASKFFGDWVQKKLMSWEKYVKAIIPDNMQMIPHSFKIPCQSIWDSPAQLESCSESGQNQSKWDQRQVWLESLCHRKKYVVYFLHNQQLPAKRNFFIYRMDSLQNDPQYLQEHKLYLRTNLVFTPFYLSHPCN